jgi:hypothetical protein
MSVTNQIVSAKIHPAIGIARVGNSLDEFFIGPEVPEADALPLDGYKDKNGALKRQVARFRLYGYNQAGEVMRELTPAVADINWTVHLANKKAAWYEFQLALDIPEASLPGAAISRRRNPQVTGEERKKLVIDPGPRSIKGKCTQGDPYRFDGGKFFDLTVPLGELRTDDEGRLLVFGGLGLSRSIASQPPLDFANNNGWHDDISDGPVDAKVILDGVEIPVEGAWVVVSPPNYAPTLKTPRTLYDLLYDCNIAWGHEKPPKKVSFHQHIRPVFSRLSALQWVNPGYASVFGFESPNDADRLMERLADATDSNKEFRQQLYAQFRNPAEGNLGKWLWPFFYGDALDSLNPQEHDSSAHVERGLASLSKTQLGCLRRWADGDFEGDFHSAKPAAKNLGDFSVAEQPAALDEAALSFCLADAFHPGCELTWIVRQEALYSSPLRIRRRPAMLSEADYGDFLPPDVAVSRIGPLSASSAGDLTRWMAVPWQTDTASCLCGYVSLFSITASLPTFWPARVPNSVLREIDYKVVIDSTQPLPTRVAAFRKREKWFRVFTNPSATTQMITDFHKLGIVQERPGVAGSAVLPEKIWVESKPELPEPPKKDGAAEQRSIRLAYALRKHARNPKSD